MRIEGRTLGIYRIEAELGRGGMGTVYRATSTAAGPAGPKGAAVALKTIHRELVADGGNAFERFRLEAEVGMRLDHPHVVRTYGVGREEVDGDDCHFIVMELIEGRTLKALVAELGTVPDHLVYLVADQVLDALDEIHGHGVVHRDIKPENIVITPDHRVLLMDLGVARLVDAQRALTHAGEFVGSLPYAAPEQFLQPDAVGPRSDLYAVGLVLFELVTGAAAYASPDLNVILKEKMKGDPPRPRAVAPDVDPFLDEVVFTCVQREPGDRFASCAELRTLLEQGEASEWWQLKTSGRAVPSIDRALKRLRLERAAPLVGRAEELARLRALHRDARRDGRLLLLGGASGVGKSRLVHDFLENLGAAGGPAVAAGRCVGGGGRAYEAFAEAAVDLLALEDIAPEERAGALEARLRELLVDTPGVVAPLAEFLLGTLQPGPDSGFSRDALLASYAGLLRRLADERPVVLVVEDLHLAGAESLELLSYLARCLADHSLFVVALYAADEVAGGTPLDELVTALPDEPHVEAWHLTPLDFVATEELVRAVVGHERSVRALGRPLHEKGDGNPLIVLEMVAHLKESGALVPAGDVYELAGTVDELAVPATARDLVRLRLGRLDEDQRETLEAAAVLGFRFEASLLASVLEEKRIQLLQRLAGLERKHRLLASSGKDAFRFASRQLYEAVYDSIPDALRTEYHAVAADVILEGLEETERLPEGPTAYALLHHLFHAERTDEAEPFLEDALAYMDQAFHATFAAPFLEKVAEALSGAAPAKRFALAMRLWAFYELLGRRDDQRRVLHDAAALAEAMGEPGPRGRVHACLAATSFYTGRFDEAGEEAERGLRLSREAGDRKWESNALHALGGVAWHQGDLPRAAERWREALAIRREIGDRRGEASTLLALGIVMPSLGEADQVLATQNEALRICREIGERRVENSLLNSIANRLVDSDRHEEALDRYAEAAEISREIGDPVSQAHVLCNLGRTYRILGRIEEAQRYWERSLALFRDLDNQNGVLDVLTLLGPALGQYGDEAAARAHLDEAIALARSIGAKLKLAQARRYLGQQLHAAGERDKAWRELEQALALDEEIGRPDSQYRTLEVMGQCAFDEGDPARAADFFRRALGHVEQGLSVGSAEALLRCRLARALQELGDAEVAEAEARKAEAMLDAHPPSPDTAPEIHYRLWEVLGDDAARDHLVAARESLTAHTQAIRNARYRDHFLTQAGPNSAIADAARRLLGEE